MFLKEELAATMMMDTRTTKTVKFRAKLKINQHDPILTKKLRINRFKNGKNILEQKNNGTVFCFKRKN